MKIPITGAFLFTFCITRDFSKWPFGILAICLGLHDRLYCVIFYSLLFVILVLQLTKIRNDER